MNTYTIYDNINILFYVFNCSFFMVMIVQMFFEVGFKICTYSETDFE